MMNISFVTDQYIDEFEFKKGITWLSTWWVPIIVPLVYFGVLEATRYWIARRVRSGKKPFDLNGVVIVHNSVLSIGSAVLFIALFTELLIQMNRTGFVRVFCDQHGEFQKGRLIWYYYLNYLFKFVELFDTELLVLRGKPTPFLHTYHHAATLVLCWSQLRAQSCMQWVPIVINLFIHVVMYAYYALHAMGRDVWWKRYLTMLQIVQFVVGLVGCFGGLMPRVFYDLGFAGVPRCWGEYEGAFFGIGVIATYLLLFMDLYKKNYKDKRVSGKTDKSAGKQAAGKANGHAGKHE